MLNFTWRLLKKHLPTHPLTPQRLGRYLLFATLATATHKAIDACLDTPGLVKISAGNYGGRLGKSFVYLYPERQAT